MTSGRKLHRRDFIKLSAAAAGAAAASACAGVLHAADSGGQPGPSALPPGPTAPPFEPVEPTLAPTSSPSPVPSPTALPPGRVVLVRTEDRVEGIRRALDLLEADPVRGKALFVKPNFNSADAFPGSTHPDTLLTLGQALQEMGAGHLTVGDRSGMGNTRAVMQGKGVFAMADELGWSTLVFDELGSEDWSLLQPNSSHWRYGFALPRPVLAADGIVQTCCLKTHRFGGQFTLSLKNSVGLAARWVPGQGYDYMSELHASPNQRRMIAEINTAYQPELIVMDAMQAFIDGGPGPGHASRPGRDPGGNRSGCVGRCGCGHPALVRHHARSGWGADLRSGADRPGGEAGAGRVGPSEIDVDHRRRPQCGLRRASQGPAGGGLGLPIRSPR